MKDKRKPASRTMAESADRHSLYEQSVQGVAEEYDFVSETFRTLRKRQAHSIREDFCGTASMCCEWVRRDGQNTATGVDIDAEVLAWGREHNLASLQPGERARVRLLQEDVFNIAQPEAVDAVLAMNFSYMTFKSREKLRDYFRKAREALADDGILFIDAFGGYEAYQEIREKRKFRHFKYIWEHASYNPINGNILCHIHFSFADGSRLKKAFTYDWRLWSLPELQELLAEAGYSRVSVYWEGTEAKSGEGNGHYAPATVGDADPSWVCFLVAEK
ncbi:MAG: class I SAM-dependent methyltransferase [Gammaproteobacteria bacterium]|jgi:cyclopropane fatty-acyl-phospholipid synthase-like methyltransferase